MSTPRLIRCIWLLGSLLLVVTIPAGAQTDTVYEVPGLELPVEIIVDKWGVPHIYGQTHYDAFFAQGFNAARDRLWQIDTWRRRGLGTLSEVLGARYVAQDRAARLFLYRGDMYREWLAYGSDAKRIAQAFTAGINAFVALTEAHSDLLPVEFELLGYRPQRWAPEDVVRIRSHGLWRNVAREVRRARIACSDGVETAGLWHKLEPDWQPQVPAGLDPCVIPEDVLRDYLLATAPVEFQRPELALDRSLARHLDRSIGSNNWAVAGSRTTTGRPILASDPHRAHAVPSLRYVAHLSAPGLNVIGAGEPALPGISIGHNDAIAFGLTIFPIDQEDLYVYERVGDTGYRYRGGVRHIETIREEVPVANAPARRVELQYTQHGPVVAVTDAHLFAVRAAWLTPGMAPYFGSVEYMRARTWREFVAALNRWGAPSENQVFADIEGNIGYKPAGLFPKRHNWDGLLPVPGDGRYEWDGYFDMDVLPQEFNPERGFTGTANSMNLPADYPIDRYKIGFEWSAPWRYQRLREVLATDAEHSLNDSTALQRDYLSVLAREVLARVPADLDSPAAQLLREWDHRLTPESGAAALWSIWYHRHLTPAVAHGLAGDAWQSVMPLDSQALIEALGYPVGQSEIGTTLAAAWRETQHLLGERPELWAWRDLHQTEFVHPLLPYAAGELIRAMRLPTHGRGGSAFTTNNTRFNPHDLLVRGGASFRMVVDVGRWDASTMTNAPGQSGDPRSPFYRNLLDTWAEDGDFPLLFSRKAVEGARAFTVRLEPSEN